jgi:hypothetical protein
MSDTPKTDAAKHASFESAWSSWVDARFAEEQERRITELAKQCVKNVEEIAALRDVLKHWKEDEGQWVKRLEWLLSGNGSMTIEIESSLDWCNSTDAIDEAMKAEAMEYEQS